MSLPSKGPRGPGKLASIAGAFLTFGTVLTILNIYELNKMKEEHNFHQSKAKADTEVKGHLLKPIVWIEGKNMHSGYLKHVFEVFKRLGYEIGNSQSNWSVFWSHEYPFELHSRQMQLLKPHQKVNHFPGTGFITNKVSLATSSNPFIPKAFKVPQDKEKLLAFVKNHSDTMWVQKSNHHRGIKIKSLKELDLEKEGSFVQEYVSKPFLIDKKKFDIGVYTILTSINPLNVYVLEESLFRFCLLDYYPFDAKNTKKYVVDDNYLPLWEIPSLKPMFEQQMLSFRHSFNAYLNKLGKNSTKVWQDIYDAIHMVYIQKEKNLISSSSKYKNTRNFFEMVRFDFVLDEDLNVYLMEVNMSPNLSSGHFHRNKLLYEHVLYNMLNLVGLGHPILSFKQGSVDEQSMRVSVRDAAVFPEWCSTNPCLTECGAEVCSLCQQCLSIEDLNALKYAYVQHIHKGSCLRVFPPSIKQDEVKNWNPSADAYYQSLSSRNKLLYSWFIGKCKLNASWCQ